MQSANSLASTPPSSLSFTQYADVSPAQDRVYKTKMKWMAAFPKLADAETNLAVRAVLDVIEDEEQVLTAKTPALERMAVERIEAMTRRVRGDAPRGGGVADPIKSRSGQAVPREK